MSRPAALRRANAAAGVARGDMPAGTLVDFERDFAAGKLRTYTRSVPWRLGDGTWVVAIEGVAGGVSLERVQPVDGFAASLNALPLRFGGAR